MNHTLLVLQRTLNRGRYNGIDAKITELLKNGITSELSGNPNLSVSSYNIEQLLNSNSVSKDNVNQLWNVYLGIIKQSNNFTKKDSQNCDELQTQFDELKETKKQLDDDSKDDDNISELITYFVSNNNDVYIDAQNKIDVIIYQTQLELRPLITSGFNNKEIFKLYLKKIESNNLKEYKKIIIIESFLKIIIIIKTTYSKDYIFLAKYNQMNYNISLFINMLLINKLLEDKSNKTFNDEEKIIFKKKFNQYKSKIEKYIEEFENKKGFIL
jgi:hypothetical protein